MRSLEVRGKTVMKNQGIFAFTTEKRKPGQADQYATNPVEVSEAPDAETALTLYRHSDEKIARALDGSGFGQLKTLDFWHSNILPRIGIFISRRRLPGRDNITTDESRSFGMMTNRTSSTARCGTLLYV